MNIQNTTSEFINNLSESSFVDLIEKDINSINHENTTSLVREIDHQVDEATDSIKKEVEQYLSGEGSSETKEKQAEHIIELIQKRSKELEEKLAKQINTTETPEKIAHYLEKPLAGVSLGAALAEKLMPQYGEYFRIGSIITGAASIGIPFVEIGIRCYSIQKLNEQIKIKESECETLVKQISEAIDPTINKQIHETIESLKLEIEIMKKESEEKIIQISKDFVTYTFEGSNKVLEFVAETNLIHHQANILHQLLQISSSISLAGSLVSFGWNTYKVVGQADQLSSTFDKIHELKNTLIEAKSSDVYLVYLIQTKLDRLEKVKTHEGIDLCSKIMNLTASTLAVSTATTAVLTAAGVAVGVAAGAVLTATGIGAAVLTGSSVALGVGMLAYDSRYDIEHLGKASEIEIKKLMIKSQIGLSEKKHQLTMSKIEQVENSLKKNNTIQNEMKHEIEQLSKEKDSKVVISKMRQIEQKNKDSVQQLTVLHNELEEFGSEENKLQSQIRLLNTELKSLNTKQTNIDSELKQKNFRNRFKKYDALTLDVIKKVLIEGLKDPESKKQIRDFLIAQKFPAPPESKLTIDDLIEYLTKHDHS